jgi:hypothetical protein
MQSMPVLPPPITQNREGRAAATAAGRSRDETHLTEGAIRQGKERIADVIVVLFDESQSFSIWTL